MGFLVIGKAEKENARAIPFKLEIECFQKVGFYSWFRHAENLTESAFYLKDCLSRDKIKQIFLL
jgi:hypothetical protein